jgi:hypothetical protein
MLKNLSTRGEAEVFKQISPVADRYGADIYRVVRVADVVDIRRLPGSLGSYALKAHLDFVVTNEKHEPLFAIEFDGPGHSPSHDDEKDEICRRANLAMFRVNLPASRVETAQLTFLEYLMHLWFLGNRFQEMRADGTIPYDEPFVMSGFLKPDAKNVFDSEFDLLGLARNRLYRFCRQNDVPGGPRWQLAWTVLGNDENGYVAFSSLPVNATKLYGRAAVSLKIPHLGALADLSFARQELGQFCTAMAIDDVVEQIRLYLTGAGHAVRLRNDTLTEISELKQLGYEYLLGLYQDEDDELSKAALRART